MSEAGRKTTGELRCETVARAGLGEPVKRRGKEFFYPCPNHDDHDPSLKINPKKNSWGCFVCGKSGNAWELAAFLARVDPNDKPALAG